MRKGFSAPVLDSRHFITPIPQARARALAKGALHFAMQLASWLSINQQARNLQDELYAWFQESGRELCVGDPDAEIIEAEGGGYKVDAEGFLQELNGI